MPALRPTSKGDHLIAYFRSGWAFLVSYLLFYLLYSWLRLPVNAGTSTSIPSLVQVYWVVHGLHLIAGSIALSVYWSHRACQPDAALQNLLWKIAPWLLLTLLISIPGVYLEMPSDPWAHFARVNEWNSIATPFDNSDWKKSGSLLAYSLIAGCTTAPSQLAAFNAFYVVCSLLYYWQYYRLARSLGFSEPQSFIAVMANFLLFGNNIFGFHRYYGMSTTVIAEIGILAFTRGLVLRFQGTQEESSHPEEIRWPQRFINWAMASFFVFATVALIAMNHVQGLLIVTVSSVAILGWRFATRSSVRSVLLLIGIILANVLIVRLWPRHPNIDGIYRPYGWLTSWYGFNLLQVGSPARERALQIIGVPGLINLVAGAVLIFRRPLIGWLTIVPLVIVCLPMFALPFADAVSRFGPPGYEYIPSYSRLLLGIPAGLALCALVPDMLNVYARLTNKWQRAQIRALPQQSFFFGLVLILTLLVTVPTSGPYFNRFWHQLMRVPQDLSEQHINAVAHFPAFLTQAPQTILSKRAQDPSFRGSPRILTTPGVGFVIASFGQPNVTFRNKWMIYPQLSTPVDRMNYLVLAVDDAFASRTSAVAVVPDFNTLISPYSFAGQLSGHWPSSQVALEQGGSAELMEILENHYGYKIAGEFKGVNILRSP